MAAKKRCCNEKIFRVVYPFDDDFPQQYRRKYESVEVCKTCGAIHKLHKSSCKVSPSHCAASKEEEF